MVLSCIICNRDSSNKFCKYHMQAYDTLKENYKAWRKAYKDVTWEEYLARLLELEETGGWIKDIIRYELQGLFNDD